MVGKQATEEDGESFEEHFNLLLLRSNGLCTIQNICQTSAPLGERSSNLYNKNMNKELAKIYEADQEDRLRVPRDLGKELKRLADYVAPRDKERQKRVLGILKKRGKNLEAIDYYHAAMVFQHSSNIKKAVSLARRSMEMNYEKAKWLYAAATDRYLVRKGRKQKFGTQFLVLNDGKIKPYPVDKRTSDKTREKYNVPSMKEALKKLQRFHKKKKK